MDSNLYIIQKLNEIMAKKNIKTPDKGTIRKLFKELEWNNLEGIIPDILEHYNGCHGLSKINHKRINHFNESLDNKMMQLKLLLDSDIDKESASYTIYYECYKFILCNRKLILKQFNDILKAFEIVNIKYDRCTFLQYDFILAKIMIKMNRPDIVNLLDLHTIKSNKLEWYEKFWSEMSQELKW